MENSICEAIAKTCVTIIKEPLSYFSEADVQQLLVENLRKIPALHKSYPTAVLKGKGSKARYTTPLVHREYGGGERTRIDAVVFAAEDVATINDVNLTVDGKYLAPRYAFELGTEKIADIASHVKSDLHKLGACKDKGYLIHFYKDVTQAATGTKSRVLTEEKIQRSFKAAFEDLNREEQGKVKLLAILLRTYRNQTKMRGKCEIYNGQTWVKVNVGRDHELREAVLAQLK
jgi:hypothetical protein